MTQTTYIMVNDDAFYTNFGKIFCFFIFIFAFTFFIHLSNIYLANFLKNFQLYNFLEIFLQLGMQVSNRRVFLYILRMSITANFQ